jgi:DNA repair protein RadC
MSKIGKKDYGPAGHRKRLRDRFSKSGRKSLADYEMLELLLTYSIPRIDTKPIAKALLHRFGSLIGVLQQPVHRLMEVHGIGPQSATFLKVLHASLTRCMEIDVETQQSISGPEDIFAFIRLHLGPRDKECVYALYLDNANRVIHHAEVAVGTVNRTSIYPREMLKPALTHDATGVVIVHNHPEGRPVPSEHDLEMTKLIEETVSPFGIKLFDHMIVTGMQAYSLKTGKLF